MTDLTALSPVVASDRYPVPVTHPDGSRTSGARVLLLAPDDDGPARMLVLTTPSLDAPLVDVEWLPADTHAATHSDPWQVATTEGVFVVGPGRGCRCGQLGSWRPWAMEQRVAVTTVIKRAREARAT